MSQTPMPKKQSPAASRARATEAAGDLRDLWPGQSVELLKALHILTREGKLNADSRRKLKQVQHLVQLIRQPLDRLIAGQEGLRLADLGAGKSYLGFILYDLLFRELPSASILSVETRDDLTARARELAAAAGFERMDFLTADISSVRIDGRIDMVTALHACDTATDDAIAFALHHEARVIALVPCCQAEIARQLEAQSKHALHQLWRHATQRREFASNLTNVIRGLFLEAHGYKVRVTELIGWEHAMKNEVILAERHQLSNPQAKSELLGLLDRIPARPRLVEGLAD
jgi:trans-aconitate methyltransferase